MCLPVVGGLIAGIGGAMSASNNAQQYKGQAALDRRQADITTRVGAYKADRKTDEVNQVLGSQRAGFAANGLALTGSAADTIADSAEEGALDVAAIRWNSKLDADNLQYKAKLNDMNAKSAQSAMPIAFLSPVIEGVAKYSSTFG